MNKMVTLFTVYVSFSWVYTQKHHHWPEYNIWLWLYCQTQLSTPVSGASNSRWEKSWRAWWTHLLRQLQMNRFWKLFMTLPQEPDVEFRLMAVLLSINSRKWSEECNQCIHLIHDVYLLRNISLKCPNQTIKMTPSFLKLDHSKAV